MKAMILAAGKGTRLLPLTENTPKALIKIQGMPLLEHTIRYLKFHGMDEIIINIHHHAKQIVDFVEKNKYFGLPITFSDESDALLDTGGGLYKARKFFNPKEPFVLTSSDVITNLSLNELIRFHLAHEPLVTLAVKHRQSSRDFLFDREYRLCGWHHNKSGETRMVREVNGPVRIAFSTIHVINPSIFRLISERGIFSLTDVYLRLAPDFPILGFVHDHSLWYECGRIENLEELNLTSEIAEIYRTCHG